MDILLRDKFLYKVTMETKVDPNAIVEKIKWHNRRDETYGILCLSISRDLLFHIDGLTSPNECYIFIIQATIIILGSLTEIITCTAIKHKHNTRDKRHK